MQVVLLEKQRKGGLGDIVEVKPGYARNYLFPRKKAVRATPTNIKHFEERRAQLEAEQAQVLSAAQKRAEQLQSKTVVIAVLASDEGKLFGSVGTRDIAEAFSKAGMAIEKKEVLLPQGALRTVGEFPIQIQIHPDVQATVTVQISASS